MKSTLSAIFFFTLFSSQAQNTILVPSKNFAIDLQPELEYFLDVDKDESMKTIAQRKFEPYKGVYFPNKYGQKLWFRVRLKNADSIPQELLFKIKAYAFIRELKIYQEQKDGFQHIFTHNTYVRRKFSSSSELSSESTFYFEVSFTWASLFKIELVSPTTHQEELLAKSTWQGAYYGFSILVLFLNIFFFFFSKSRLFLYYTIFQLGIIFSIAFLDNYIYDFFGNSLFTRSFGKIYNLIISLGGFLFFDSSLELKRRFPLFKKICIVLWILSAFLFSKNLIFGGANLFGTAMIVSLTMMLFGYLTAIYFSRQTPYARFIVAGVTVLLICHVLYSLPVLYGYPETGFYEWHYKIGSVIEMLIFMAAIPYRHRVLADEKTNLEKSYSEQQKYHEAQLKELQPLGLEEKIEILSDRFQLKNRELDISRILILGATNKEISEQLFISLDTVKHYCSIIYKKTGVKNRSQFITLFNSTDFIKEGSDEKAS